ncbi:MAG: transcription elongation factor GreA [Oscillospiraceae bacterium]|jgi:transcription elongation factor GreA|nr:transcription elongation factor GreA [Oscillospiraceae bacterium]MCI9581179.1 transcription elongation factor GreA [Oscillospiraceae bacterium]
MPELTKKDLEKIRQELDHRRIELRPQLLEAVKEARAFGDLSENFEYKAAKQEKNKNEGRIRFLERTLKTARVVEDRSAPDAVGLYDKVTVLLEDEEEPETYQIVTTLRQDVLRGIISKESPMGRALMGRRVGDRAVVELDNGSSYEVVIQAIEKGEDDGSLPLNRF